MPKVNYTNTKGLYQEAGKGLDLTDGVFNHCKKVINVTGDTTLTNLDAGAIVLLNNGTVATDVTLPAAASCDTGTIFTFVPQSDNTNGYTIKGPEGDAVMYGRLPVYSTTDDKLTSVAGGSGKDTLTLNATANNANGGAIGSVVRLTMMGDGSWGVSGHVISKGTAPASSTVLSNTA